MDMKEKAAEILEVKGTIQYLPEMDIHFFAAKLAAEVRRQSVNTVQIECENQSDYSIHLLWKRLVHQFKVDGEAKRLVEKAIRITQDDSLYWDLTLRELGGLFDDVLAHQEQTLVIVLLKANIFQIDKQLLKFVDEITSLPLITETQWCFIFSSRELLVVLGLLTPEEYVAREGFLEKHEYHGKFKGVKRNLDQEVRVAAAHTSEPVTNIQGEQTSSINKNVDAFDNIPENAFLIIEGVKVHALDQLVVSIGRKQDNHLVIDDPRVARRHAELRAIRGRFVLFDLNSTGGTFVNGQRTSQTVLYPGDVISLAGVTLIFEQDTTPSRAGFGGPSSLEGEQRDIKQSVEPITSDLMPDICKVNVKTDSGSFQRGERLRPKEWVSIGNINDPKIWLDFIQQPINFSIYRTGLGNCLLINNSEVWSISLASKNLISPINPFKRVATLTKERVLFLESSLEVWDQLEIQLPDDKLYIEINID
jgi:pSer/pThr/pTyr-binding forkhead associated (FHA) protein